MSKDKLNVPNNNPYKRDNREDLDNQRDYFTPENKMADFSEFF